MGSLAHNSSWIVFKTLPGSSWKKLLFVVPVYGSASGIPHTGIWSDELLIVGLSSTTQFENP